MRINISSDKILLNVLPKVNVNKKISRLGQCNHCGGTLKNEFDRTVCIMCSRDLDHACSNCAHFLNK